MWNQVTGGNNRLARRPNTIDADADGGPAFGSESVGRKNCAITARGYNLFKLCDSFPVQDLGTMKSLRRWHGRKG
jgi:hypothetical protein